MSWYEELVMRSQENYARFNSLYRRGGTAVELSARPPRPYGELIRDFARAVREAECVLVGGASGLSAAGGGDFYYEDNASYRRHFGKFAEVYHFKGAFDGMYHRFSTRGETWGYLATFLHATLHAPLREPYKDLDRVLAGKDFHILTTTPASQVSRHYPMERIRGNGGDHRIYQCLFGCRDETWDSTVLVDRLFEAMGEGRSVPEDLIPRCPHCGAELFPWVRGYGNFLQGAKYEEEYEKVSRYLLERRGRRTLYLELGVGRLTPMFIQEPFWSLTAENPGARYISVNDRYGYLPKAIEDRGFVIVDDIAKVLRDGARVMAEGA